MTVDSDPEFTKVSEDDLSFEPFTENKQVRDFDCGDKDLNDFLNTEEVANYERENLGRTQMVYLKGELVGYFTTSPGDLRREKVKHVKSFTKYPHLEVENFPALLIGRFAVAKKWHRKGIGRMMMRHVMGMAQEFGEQRGARLVVLNATSKDAIKFYTSVGFALTDERKERGRQQRTMFFDLRALEGDDANSL
ncbi:MAG: GNAT family N-acetyltransferase [Halobacteriales archaeon]|nr:GNAT family N-acetyltransferase [Halobacteriales archaeon]